MCGHARCGRERNSIIPDKESPRARRDRQTAEIRDNQKQLRSSIADSKRLVDEADAMIQRHRTECDAAGDGK